MHQRGMLIDRYQAPQQSGTTLPEILVAIVMLGALTAIAAPTLLQAREPSLPDSVNRLAGQLRLARSKAIAQTSAYRIYPPVAVIGTEPDELVVERASSCGAPEADWDVDPAFQEEDRIFGENVGLNSAKVNNVNVSPKYSWKVCFDSRGTADKNLVLTFSNIQNGGLKTIEVFPGGAVQVHEN